MKSIIKTMGPLVLIMALMMAFSNTAKGSGASEKSCKLTVYYQNGDPADYVTVTAATRHGQHDYKTDDKGRVTLTWEYSDITHLYVKGDKYEVDYRDGGNYTLTLKKKHKYD